MPDSLLIADTVYVHSFTGLGIGDSSGGQGVGVSNGDWAAVATLRNAMLYGFRGTFVLLFK
jgi:hypothetical protein